MLARKYCQYVYCSKPVFNIPNIKKNITYHEIDGLLSATKRMSNSNKREVFYSNGVDYDMVEKYYDCIKSLEKSYLTSYSTKYKEIEDYPPWHYARLLMMYLALLFIP